MASDAVLLKSSRTLREKVDVTGNRRAPRHECFCVGFENSHVMTNHIEPTEEYDGRIRVKLLDDYADTRVIPCSSYTEAITLVKEHQHEVTTAKIIDREQEVVFSSADMDIDVWESIWKNEKRRLSVNVEDRDCPYDNISCFFDDLCVQCKMDKLQDEF